MKHMKYIKNRQIFEAFESNKLSKTLGYMDSKRDKEDFLDKVKTICDNIDFPYSELSDEYFDYLPFNAALKKADIITDEPCVATSAESFPEYAVEGEICNKGKVKRKWGHQVRSVVCPKCNGTGVKPKKGEVKLVKFWFDKDGKFIQTTCVDGIVRNNRIGFDDIPLPQTPSSYTVSGEKLNNSNSVVQSLQNGQYVHISINNKEVYAYIIVERGGGVFAIQPDNDGGRPYYTNSRFWKKIARNSWSISGGEFQWIIPVSLNNTDEDSEKEPDPYTWNIGLTFGYRGISSSGRDIENDIKAAHFAIVMDFGKLKKAEFKTRTVTKEERTEAKDGALSFRSNDSIKQENIERYIKKLSNRLEVDGESVANLQRIIKKLLNYKNTVYNLNSGDITNSISKIVKGYINLLSTDDTNKERYLGDLNDNIKYYFRENISINRRISKNLKEVGDRLIKEDKKLQSEILKLMSELSMVIYERITSFEIETIEDLEILNQKVLGMRNIINSERYHITNLRNFMDYLNRNSSDYSYRYLCDNYYVSPSKIDNIKNGIEIAIRIIKKM